MNQSESPQSSQSLGGQTAEASVDSKPALNAGQRAAARYVSAMGSLGAQFFAEGLSFEEAVERTISILNDEISRQADELKRRKRDEEDH